jgi:hypothetical protein
MEMDFCVVFCAHMVQKFSESFQVDLSVSFKLNIDINGVQHIIIRIIIYLKNSWFLIG